MSQSLSARSRSAVRYGDAPRIPNTAAGLCSSSTVNSDINSVMNSGINSDMNRTTNTTMTGIGCGAGEVDGSVPLTGEMNGTCEIGSHDGTREMDAAEDENKKSLPDVFSTLPNGQGENLFLNRTNDNCIRYGRKKVPTTPFGINTSHQSQSAPQPHRFSSLYSKSEETSSGSTGREPLLNSRHTPLSFIVTGGGSSGKSRTGILREENIGNISGRRWILTDNSKCHAETGEEPVLLSTILDNGWGKMCEEEAAWWKHRCVMAEQQLAIALQRVNEYSSTTTRVTRSLSSSSSSSKLGTLTTQEKDKASVHSPLPSELELENKRLRILLAQIQGNDMKLQEEKRESAVVQRKQDIEPIKTNGIDVLIKTSDREVQCMLDETNKELQESVILLRSERDALKNELYGEVIKRENLETSLIAKEEHQALEREEWLSKEANFKKKQELLATSLRQAHLNVSSMSDQIEEKEKELQKVQSQLCTVETELSVSKAEVMRLKETGEKTLQEGQRLQEQLRTLEADLYLHGDLKKEEKSVKDGSNLRDSIQEHTEGLLRRAVTAMRRVESDEKWIASQIVQTLKNIGVTELSEKKQSSSSSSLQYVGRIELQQLVRSIEKLIASTTKLLKDNNDDDWRMTTDNVHEEKSDTLSIITLNDLSYTDLLARAQDCVSRLETCINTQNRQHMELKEELEVVRRDRNELVGQQSKQVRHLQKLLLTVEQEKTRLLLDIEERDKMIQRLKEESSLSTSIKNPTSSSSHSSEIKHISTIELQMAKERLIAVHKFYHGYLKRLLDHVSRQSAEFYDALHSRMMLGVECFARWKSEELAHVKGRVVALQGQLQRFREERGANQRVQDDCFAALRAQLVKVRAELAAKESALRSAQTGGSRSAAAMPQADGNSSASYSSRYRRSSASTTPLTLWWKEEREEREEKEENEIEDSLQSPPSPNSPTITLPPLLATDVPLPPLPLPSLPPPILSQKQQEEKHNIEAEKEEEERDSATPLEETRSGVVSAHSYDQNLERNDVTPIHFTRRITSGRRTVTFAPTVIVVEQPEQEEEDAEEAAVAADEADEKEKRGNKREQYKQQTNPLPYSDLVSRSPSSSFSSSSSPTKTGKETQVTTQAVQRGVMRKHQEVWLRQAEIMGIPIDEAEHQSPTYPSLFMQLPTP